MLTDYLIQFNFSKHWSLEVPRRGSTLGLLAKVMAQTKVFCSLFRTTEPFSMLSFATSKHSIFKAASWCKKPIICFVPKVTRQIYLFGPSWSKHIKKDNKEVKSDKQQSEEGAVDDDFVEQRNEERMFLIQPDFKWGKGRFLSRAVHSRLDEAEALVKSVSNWQVASKTIESVHELNPKFFFGTGKLDDLQGKVEELKRTKNLSAVFVNTGKLTQKQANGLEEMFDCRVYDRYRIVLEIFKERARTKEAKLQVKLAELKYKK